jgi:tRNA pseudouridine synthase 10
MDIIEKTQKMLEKYPLCNHCLGRQYALLGHGLGNEKRGENLKLLLVMKGHQLALLKQKAGIMLLKTMATNGSFNMAAEMLKKMHKRLGEKCPCHLCKGQFDQLDKLSSHAVEKLRNYEYTTFLIGIELPTEVEEREDEFKAEFEVTHGESMKNHFSREIGKRVSETIDKMAELKKPDIVVFVNPFSEQIKLQSNPLFISGRYRKLVRGISQSKWICTQCRGKGCEKCNWTGKMLPESVEEIIVKPLLEKILGEDASFHAAGREDVDALMLGRGRPFIVEVKKPKKRFIDLKNLAEAINREAKGKVKVSSLHFTNRSAVRGLKKTETSEKIYRMVVEFDKTITDEDLKALEKALTGAVIYQQTPSRVLHRRTNRVREKHIYEAKINKLSPNRVEMKIRCQGGLYIKELVTGDKGRTDPCVSGIVNAEAKPLKLDVLNVIMKENI